MSGMVLMKCSLAFAVLVFCSLILSGCVGGVNQTDNSTGFNVTGTVNSSPSTGVSARPLTDTAVLNVRVLEVYPESAALEVLQVLSYASDSRDGTVKIASGNVRNFTFQWGTRAVEVDLPPVGPSSNDVRQSGVENGSILNVNASVIENSWIVYAYEQLG